MAMTTIVEKLGWKYMSIIYEESNYGIKVIFLHLCPDHVILTGRQMTNLVSSFEYLLLLCFLTEPKF